MKKVLTWRLMITLVLLACSAAVYAVHYFLFRDFRGIFFNLISDFAFLFIYALIILLVVERLLAQREKLAMMKKMNMVIGTFFSEVGLELLRKFSAFADNASGLAGDLQITSHWGKKDFQRALALARTFSYSVRIDASGLPDLRDLRRFLLEKRSFLLRLLENPNLLEHEGFTDLLWAVFHLTDELAYRIESLEGLPAGDLLHLAADLKRAYSQLTKEWIAYMGHLKESYPFLFSLAARINPFNPKASAVVE